MKRALLALALLGNGPLILPDAPAGKAQVVFYRGSSLAGAAIPCTIFGENGGAITTMYRGKYTRVAVDPGPHAYAAKGDAVKINAEAGQTYYVSCSIGMGIMAGRAHVHLSNADEFTRKSNDMKEVLGVEGQ